MNDDRHGVEVLRESVEAVATEIEARARAEKGVARPRPASVLLLAVAATAVLITLGLWALRPVSAAEVEILEFRIDGRPVTGIVLDDPAAGGWIIRPQIGGRPLAALVSEGDLP